MKKFKYFLLPFSLLVLTCVLELTMGFNFLTGTSAFFTGWFFGYATEKYREE